MAMNATMTRRGTAIFGLALCFSLSIAHCARANDSTAQTKAGNAPAEFATTIEDCRQNLARLQGEVAASQQSGTAVSRFLTAEIELWGRLELLTLQRKTVLEDDARYRGELASLESEQAGGEPPKSFLEVDNLRDRLESEKQKLHSLQLEWESEKQIMLAVKQKFEDAEQLRRRTDERFESSAPDQRAVRQRERLLARLQSRVLSAELEFHREQAGLMDVKIQALEATVKNIESTVEAYASKYTLTKQELDQRFQLIDQMEAQVRQQLSEVDARLHASMQSRNTGSPNWSATAYDVAREESQLFQRLLAGVGEFKECWRRRFSLSNGQASANEISKWLEEIEQTKEQVAQIVDQLERRTQQRRESLSQINRAELTHATDQTTSDLQQQAAELHRIIDVYGNIQVLASGGERLCQRSIEDLKARESRFSLSEYRQLAIGGLRSGWEYELTTIDDEPITVRKIVFGFVLLLCGYYISRWSASALAYRVSPKLGVSPAGAAVLRSVLFYLLVTAFGFASLEIVNVPLTIFAFLGGAVAIGVGFGSQNLINNFMSGLILLVERPIRIGDLVNVDGIDANVEHIGARSTRVRTGANLEILVPNSKFLENNVTNWTLSDTRTRTSLSVGVAYGSPVREVSAILNQVIRQHAQALASPEPIVLFQDFADSALIFEVHFWINMKRMMDGAKIRSEVRMAIDDAFREAGIVIAFPQRDVHIDMSEPIQVRLSEPSQFEAPRRRAA